MDLKGCFISSSTCPDNSYWYGMGVCFLDTLIILHLAALNFIPHVDPQLSSKFRSFCRSFWSCLLLISLYTRQSSAKSLTLEEITDGKSLMCSKNRIGPKTVPCGTPESTVTRSDQGFFYELKWTFLKLRKVDLFLAWKATFSKRVKSDVFKTRQKRRF